MSTPVLPDMTVEERVSTTAHAIPAPTHDFNKELNDAIAFNHATNLYGWSPLVLSLLKEHIPQIPNIGDIEIQTAVKQVAGFSKWSQVAEFVKNDECLDFYMKLKYYVGSQGFAPKQNLDFIDGTGIGFYVEYTDRVKVTLEQAFDAKYFYKMDRPLVYGLANGMDCLPMIANHIHPGHWSYPAGHGTKFLTAIEVINELFTIPALEYRKLLLVACVLAHGRSGSLIHYPSDNLAGGYLTTLPEFST